jgi:hypothetical protein
MRQVPPNGTAAYIAVVEVVHLVMNDPPYPIRRLSRYAVVMTAKAAYGAVLTIDPTNTARFFFFMLFNLSSV